MPFYRFSFEREVKGIYHYPEAIARVQWKSLEYHTLEQWALGETDTDIEADGKRIIRVPDREVEAVRRALAATYSGKETPFPDEEAALKDRPIRAPKARKGTASRREPRRKP